MNHLIIQSSSINIINALNLSTEQAAELKKMAEEFHPYALPYPDTSSIVSSELVEVRHTYAYLIGLLLERRKIEDSLRERIYSVRATESEIIKRSLLGKTKNASSCMRCHCYPDDFPRGDISKKGKRIKPWRRKKIDKAHLEGLFSKEGILYLWYNKTKVDLILNRSQRLMLNGFRCSLIPTAALSGQDNVGQAFSEKDWDAYFDAVRKADDWVWKHYRKVYLKPLDDALQSMMPGIRRSERKIILNRVKPVLEDARAYDDMEFALEKDGVYSRMNEAMSIDFLNGENKRSSDQRQFLTAMFLLYPGSAEMYTLIESGQR